MLESVAGIGQDLCKGGGLQVDLRGDRLEGFGTVVDGIHSSDDREQNLSGADVAGRLLATDVLLSGLKCEAVSRCTLGVNRDAY